MNAGKDAGHRVGADLERYVSAIEADPARLASADQRLSQVETLQRENEELREIQGDYQLLQDLFNRARETPQFRRQTASVIGYDTSPLFRSIILDKGSEDGVFVGSDTQLVAPVRIARGSTIGAGSTITRDTPADKLTLSRSKQVTIEAWKRPIRKNRK